VVTTAAQTRHLATVYKEATSNSECVIRPISLLTATGKLFIKVVLKAVQKHIEKRGLLNTSQFGFHACHSTTLQCMRLMNHVIRNFNDKMSTATVLLDIKKAFDTTWYSGLLYKLSKFEFSSSLIKLFGGRRNVYAKGNASRGATRFGPGPYPFQYVHN
jgi:hypothetical protein